MVAAPVLTLAYIVTCNMQKRQKRQRKLAATGNGQAPANPSQNKEQVSIGHAPESKQNASIVLPNLFVRAQSASMAQLPLQSLVGQLRVWQDPNGPLCACSILPVI